jgi:hypothetical protein
MRTYSRGEQCVFEQLAGSGTAENTLTPFSALNGTNVVGVKYFACSADVGASNGGLPGAPHTSRRPTRRLVVE